MRDSWNELTIGDEINFLGGFPFSSSKFNEEGVGVPLIRIRDLLKSSQETYFSGLYSNTYLINEGDVLIGMDGDFHIVKWKNSPSLLNQRILKVSGKKSGEIDIDFLFYYLKPFLLDVHNKTAATTVKHLSTFDVSREVDLFPPLPQQQKIAKILSTVDNVIEQTESTIAKYQAIKQGLMHDLFTRGIDVNTGKLRPTPHEAPDLYKESALGFLPRDWEVEELGNVGDVKMCKRIFSYQTKNEGDIPFYKIGTFGRKPDAFISKELYKEFKNKYSFPSMGSILISASGTIGRLVVYKGEEAYFQDSNIVWIENNFNLISNEYLKYIFPFVKFKTEGGTIQRLYNNILKSGVFPCPSNSLEQELIVKKLSVIDNKIQTEQQALAKYQQLKAGLLQDLLTGKVEVSED